MDPWIEQASIWPDVHQRLITYAGDALQACVGPAYFVAIGARVYLETAEAAGFYPDVSVVEAPVKDANAPRIQADADQPTVLMVEPVERREAFLEIRDAAIQGNVVTVLEVLSPSNKRPGPGRELYLAKQREVMASTTSLVEIDLLRSGEPTVAAPAPSAAASPYRVVVSPAADRRRRELYGIMLRQRLPRISVPLLAGAGNVVLDLQAVLTEAYAKGAYARRIDYAKLPTPPLTETDLAWARDCITAARA
jgi:hypothetical protein